MRTRISQALRSMGSNIQVQPKWALLKIKVFLILQKDIYLLRMKELTYDVLEIYIFI